MNEKIVWTLEQAFTINESYKLTGKIDCMGVSDRSVILIDFKSTASAASSNTEILDMDSLQLWTYAKAASTLVDDFVKKNIVLGYVSLDKPSESNILITDEDLKVNLKTNKFCKFAILEEPFLDKFQEALGKMDDLVDAIQEEKKFLARPRKSTTCRFCELSKVCVKSEMINE